MLGVRRSLLPVKAGDVVRFINLGDGLQHRIRFYTASSSSGRTLCWKWFWCFREDDNNGAVAVPEGAVTCLKCAIE